MSRKIKEVLSERTDISRFVVHLTKNTNDGNALENLVSILNDKEIRGRNHHCLFSPMLRAEEEDLQERFNVVCFTETPLDKIHLLTEISNRKVNLEPYGIVFKKEKIRKSRGNPVFYIYEENHMLIRYFKKQYEEFIEEYYNEDTLGAFFTLGSIINIVKKGHDFHWEREWRVRKRLRFTYDEIYAVIAPRNKHEKIKKQLRINDFNYIPFIDSKWNYEEMLERISYQLWEIE
ncbi:hypothetical protein [Bacillus sp. T3]|uniref:hypothetical protein n=1 Tax=Bacillus sp. T3 TaxID=467262 RepID=UPI0029826370|nr:hypothetical protein [Bacillus sp. T3]